MKYIFFLTIFLLIGCNSCSINKNQKQKAQKKEDVSGLTIKPLHGFENDTIKYLFTNVIQQKKFFVDKKLLFLIDNLEIPVENYLIGSNFNQPDSIPSITLLFTNMNSFFVNKKEKKYILLNIEWVKPVDKKSSVDLMNKTKGRWTDEAYNFYKDRLVKDITTVEQKP